MASEADLTSLLNEMVSESSTPVPGQTLLPNGKKTKGRVKIKMEYIGNKLRRYTTFSKRKTGIMKKAYELSTLTGTQVMLLVASETGHVYAFATNKLKPMIASDAGRSLIQSCLNTPDDAVADVGACKTEFTFEPPSGSMSSGTPRKRKIQETETLCLPTMVSSGSTHSTSPMNVEDYCESDNDSDTNESPDTVMENFEDFKSPVPPPADPQLLQKTLKEAFRAAGIQRQNLMNKKQKIETPPISANPSRSQIRKQKINTNNEGPNLEQLSSLLPLMLQGNSNLFNNSNSGNGEDANSLASIFPLAFGGLSLQQVLAATALMADSQGSLKS